MEPSAHLWGGAHQTLLGANCWSLHRPTEIHASSPGRGELSEGRALRSDRGSREGYRS
uniref:Uncharacterized protein n=1 Tax=Anguilla anguilla TaxID=7936 RepID=A0A0E9WHS9_ANGAN